MSQTQALMDQETRYGAHNYLPLPVVLSKGEGIWVYDVEGNRYLDFLSCYSAVNHGHRHPKIVEALTEQLGRLTLTSRAFYNDQLGPFLEELADYTHMDMILPMNTGAEAVETAVKAVRRWGYRVKGIPAEQAEIIVCNDNFHGRTVTVISFSSEQAYRADFGPYTPGFTIIPYGDSKALEDAITDRTCAFLVEPIQGEAGVMVPPDGYLKDVRRICTERNVLLALDEVQTGFGRTGKRFCHWHDEIEPDVLVMGKALGGGVYPVSAIAAKREILGLFEPGSHGSTFGGNPLGAAVARRAIKVIEDEGLAERADELGRYFTERLLGMGSPYVDHVRGKGLLIGLVLKNDAGSARPFAEALMKRGLLCKETHENVLRFAPPLVIEKKDLDWALEHIEAVLTGPAPTRGK
ncbi:MAG: ornithine--oxo-acid transaminase [Deltaproteobacteria bacterium]|nr:ornithine--oxo-acid transaminase [Deltaproteobacteria bacterium]